MDLVARLRAFCGMTMFNTRNGLDMTDEAADEIERLRAELDNSATWLDGFDSTLGDAVRERIKPTH